MRNPRLELVVSAATLSRRARLAGGADSSHSRAPSFTSMMFGRTKPAATFSSTMARSVTIFFVDDDNIAGGSVVLPPTPLPSGCSRLAAPTVLILLLATTAGATGAAAATVAGGRGPKGCSACSSCAAAEEEEDDDRRSVPRNVGISAAKAGCAARADS